MTVKKIAKSLKRSKKDKNQCLCPQCALYPKCLEFSKRVMGRLDEETVREILKTFDIHDLIFMFGGLLVSHWLKERRR